MNLDDPRTLALLQMGLGLLGGAPNSRKNFGADIAHAGLLGLGGLQQGKAFQMKQEEERQQREMRDMQMAQIRRDMERQGQMDTLAKTSFAPNQNLVANDDQGFPMPSSGGGGMPAFAQGMAQIDPMKAIVLQSQLAQMQQKNYQKLGPGESLYDVQNPTKPITTAPQAPKDWQDPAYQKFMMEKAAAGRPQVSVNTKVDAYTPASEEAQKEFMKSSRATYDQLKQAPVALESIEKAKALIPGARGFMGPGGEGMLGAAKFLNNRLGMSIKTEGVKDAEELRTRIFFNIMDNLKKMDAQPSQMQQQIMMESLGKLGTDPNALPGILDAYADVIKGKVDLHNKEVTGAIERGVKFPYDPVISMTKRGPLKMNQTAIFKAKQAIQRGADPMAVRQRLREQGYDDSGL